MVCARRRVATLEHRDLKQPRIRAGASRKRKWKSRCKTHQLRDMVGEAAVAMLTLLASAVTPTVDLTSGVLPGATVKMPILAAGTAGYKGADATAAVQGAIAAGFSHIHTAFDYYNLPAIGAALKGIPRDSIFVSTMTSPCVHAAPPKRNVTDAASCYNLTMTEAKAAVASLGLERVDLLMLHGPSEAFGHVGPCSALACKLNAAQWRAYGDLLTAGVASAIGVSNYCQSCLSCLGGHDPVHTPAVNQIQVHVGQGSGDPGGGLLSYCAKRGIVVQAYEPLAGGALVTDDDCATIGTAHNKSAAQVALRWVLQRAPSLVVRAGSAAHLVQDLDVTDFTLNDAELETLDRKTSPPGEAGGRCSWGCTE